MFDDDDGFFLGDLYGSSPIREQGQDNGFSLNVPSPGRIADFNDIDFSSLPSLDFTMTESKSYASIEEAAPALDQQKITKRSKTPKKKSMIFKPFASFESTELTVESLKNRLKPMPRAISYAQILPRLNPNLL